MQAAFYERTGPAKDVLRVDQVATPVPGPGEVRVRVTWSGVNPSDVKGTRRCTGEESAVSAHHPTQRWFRRDRSSRTQCPSTRVGQRVRVWNTAWMRPFGTAAQSVVLPSEQAVPLPQNVDLAAGACLGIPALTAYYAVTADGGMAGKNVLVAGGAGAVGHYAIQLAKLKGARRVIATVSEPEKAALAREAGADVILNYRTDDLPVAISDATASQGTDRIVEVDLAANIDQDIDFLHPDGEVIVYGSGDPQGSSYVFFHCLQSEHGSPSTRHRGSEGAAGTELPAS